MISDLQANGMNSRYKKHLGGPIYELKSRAEEGGARVYFFQISQTEFALCRAECKTEDAASAALLNWTIAPPTHPHPYIAQSMAFYI